MPAISRFYGILIQMFCSDKHNPHFHAVHAEYKAIIEIQSGRIVAGKLPRHARQLVREWTRQHRAELLNNWERARGEEPLKPIAPLE